MSEFDMLAILRAKPGREEGLCENLIRLVGPSREEAGNLRYDLYRDTADPARFVFVERWASQADQQQHHNFGPHIQAFHSDGAADIDSREAVLLLERLT
ncbi:putative quinol monooxygenase [Stenotrophomonas sp. NPDC077659]|uniref:putative quinol monooxygenase n=1 Tax=Stenotrophomonas sp. NPDC077659 TaxID=3390694 RepID=UPI003D047DC2